MANPTDLVDFLRQWGVPTFVGTTAVAMAPKLWAFIRDKASISRSTNDLQAAGLQGVNEVVTTLRNQLTDMTAQLKDFQSQIDTMRQTLDKAISDRVLSQQDAAQAKSDLFNLRLYANRLVSQIKGLGAVPVDE
jgi:TolA-binding protein